MPLSRYYLELLTSETMKLLKSFKSQITKDEHGENVPCLSVTEVLLIHCNIVNNGYQQDSRVVYTFAPNKLFGNFQIFHQHILCFKNFQLRLFIY